MKIIIFLLTAILAISCTGETGSVDDSRQEPEKVGKITRLEKSDVSIIHNFPDTLYSGDKVLAEIESSNPDWSIVRAYVNCPIGTEDGLEVMRRSWEECMELLVDENKVLIAFTDPGTGEREFGPVTLVLENEDGLEKATELEFPYFLKEKQGLESPINING